MTTVKNVPGANSRENESALDSARLRAEFPILSLHPYGKQLVYLDNAATTQKPRGVIDAITRYYSAENSNIHRGVHYLSQLATRIYEEARHSVQQFINAAAAEEIVFVRGTTEAINLVAHSHVRPRLAAGDEIVITGMEHHSNIVPWQMLCEATGAVLRVVPITDSGDIEIDRYRETLSDRTAIVAAVYVSNALGTVNPVREMIELAHARDIPVLLDGAQAVAHMPVDVEDLDCDFFAFSGHKTFGPTGIGVLYGKKALLEEMDPYQGGGDMISSVTFEKTTYNHVPHKFEAGTPNIAGAVGLRHAIDFVLDVGLDRIMRHERDLLAYATERIAAIDGIQLIGTPRGKAPHDSARAGVLSFMLDGVHPHDLGTIIDREGVAIRTGHHCAQPIMERFGVPATARASFALYNTRDEIDQLVAAIEVAKEVFA